MTPDKAAVAAVRPRDLVLPLKAEYFNAIKSGEKLEEYREVTDFWRRRIEAKTFDRIILTLGYPKTDDSSRRLVCEWRGYQIKKITHPHFGNVPTTVFAIDVSRTLGGPDAG